MHRPFQSIVVFAAIGLCLYLVFIGSSGSGKHMLPEGTQTLTGTLIPAELSLKRRGTHVLKVQAEEVAFVESTSVNLRMFELTTVGITGTFVHNTVPSDLPVLIATSIRAVELPAKPVDLPSVGLTVNVPMDWSIETFDDGVAFSQTGSATPLLRVMKTSLTRLPSGTPMLVGGYDAVRIESQGGQIVHLDGGRTIVTFTLNSRDDAVSAAFAQLLRTAVVRGTQLSSQRTMTGGMFVLPSSAATGSSPTNGVGRPCGGPAGVLCPTGTYCAVHSTDGVGTCVML